jgi:hypothetical protein
LCSASLVAEAFGVDTTGHGFVLEDADSFWIWSIVKSFGQWFLSSYRGWLALFLDKVKEIGFLHGFDDCFKRLEVTHTLEAVQCSERHRKVFAAADGLEEELVHRQVRVREVELNLYI